jgi:hypothetical protein
MARKPALTVKGSLFPAFLALSFLMTTLLVVGNFLLVRKYLSSVGEGSRSPPWMVLATPEGEELEPVRMGPPPAAGDQPPSERRLRFEGRDGEYLLTIENRMVKEREKKQLAMRLFMAAGVLTVFLSTALSGALLLWYLRRNSALAMQVMNAVASGKLGARFPVRRFDEAGRLMMVFNEMAERIEQLVDRIKRSEEARLQFFQNLSHDLRTPLGSLRMIVETLQRKSAVLPAAKVVELAEAGLQEIDYVGTLVDDLLFLALVEDPSSELKQEPVRPGDALRSEIPSLATAASLKGKSVELRVDPAAEDFERLRHPDLFRRLVRNLVANGVDFARANVVVTLRREGGCLLLQVRDDGPGLPAEVLATFGEKRMVRVQSGHFSGRASLGLGTAIVRSISERIGATLKAYNDGGAVIEIRIGGSAR